MRDRLLRREQTLAAVLMTGDFNAMPVSTPPYPALTYNAIKSHPLGFRSVYNDDELAQKGGPKSFRAGLELEGVYTTWKARVKKGVEKISKHCIDYIFYTPYTSRSRKIQNIRQIINEEEADEVGEEVKEILELEGEEEEEEDYERDWGVRMRCSLRAKAVLDVFTEEEVGAALLPSFIYPSDHLAIAADFLLEWREEDGINKEEGGLNLEASRLKGD